MPDWVVHICVAYLICRILYFKYPLFDSANTILCMIGSLIPDIIKLQIIFGYFGLDWSDILLTFHIPLTSFIIAGIMSLFFENKKIALLFLIIGAITHFIMDVLLIDIEGGAYLFFPLSWQTFHLDLIPPDDYVITLITLTVTLTVYFLGPALGKLRSNYNHR